MCEVSKPRLLGAELLYDSVFPSVCPTGRLSVQPSVRTFVGNNASPSKTITFIFCILYIVYCTYIVYCIRYHVSCIMYPVFCILYSLFCIFYFLSAFGYNLFFLEFSCQWCLYWNSLCHASLLLNVFRSCFSVLIDQKSRLP